MTLKKFIVILSFLFLCKIGNAQHWATLDNGIDNRFVTAMFADTIDNLLYVGGQFSTINGLRMRGDVTWNGLAWDSLTSGIDDFNDPGFPANTWAFARYNNKIYVGGSFLTAGGLATPYLAAWNGTSWDSFPPQVNHVIADLVVNNNELYACGYFDSVGTIPAQRIAKWNGSNWTSLNLNLHNALRINCMCFFQNELYIAGIFYQDSINDGTSGILKYSSNTWQTVGGGIRGLVDEVASMVVYNNELYVSGDFSIADGNAGNNIQKWNGSVWSGVGGGTGGVNGQIHKIFVHDGKLYAVGAFQIAGGIPAEFIATWDGINWCGLGSSFDNIILTGAFFRDTLYVAGGFNTIDGITVNRIAKWTGGNFTSDCGNTSGMQNLENYESDFSIFPNPTSGKFSVLCSEKIDAIEIYNVLGEKLFQSSSFASNVDLSKQGAGIYFVSVRTKKKIITEKILKY